MTDDPVELRRLIVWLHGSFAGLTGMDFGAYKGSPFDVLPQTPEKDAVEEIVKQHTVGDSTKP